LEDYKYIVRLDNMKIEKLPLLEFLEQKYAFELKQPFKNYSCLFIQHLLGSSISLIKSFEMGGINKEDLYIIGKAYSSNQEVLKYLDDNGYNYSNPLDGYSIDCCYDEILRIEIRNVINLIIKKSDLQILIIDDGAKGISILHEESFINYLHRFKCVELTTRGVKEINGLSIKCPIIDVATCYAKKNIEAPLIGFSMVSELYKFLVKWKPIFPHPRNILVIGYGTIGRVVCSELRKRFSIFVFDNNREQLAQAMEDGITTIVDISNFFAEIVIGCTGTSTIRLDELANYDRSLFVNMASSDLEFGLWRFKGEKIPVYFDSVMQEFPLHMLYKIKNNSKTYFISNTGFPIDFNGDIDPIHPLKIQITRSLVLAAAIQVLDETKFELIALNIEIQNQLINLLKLQEG